MRLRRLDNDITYISVVVIIFTVLAIGLFVIIVQKQIGGIEELVVYCRTHLDYVVTGDFGGKCSEIVKNYDEAFNRTSIMGHS